MRSCAQVSGNTARPALDEILVRGTDRSAPGNALNRASNKRRLAGESLANLSC